MRVQISARKSKIDEPTGSESIRFVISVDCEEMFIFLLILKPTHLHSILI